MIGVEWNEYGLAGLVVGALLVGLGRLVAWLVKHVDKQADMHRDERDAWRRANEEVLRELTSVIRDLRESWLLTRDDRD